MKTKAGSRQQRRKHSPDSEYSRECGKQGEVPIYPRENPVKRSDQYDVGRDDDEIARDAETKESFVRDDVPGCLCGIVGDNELAADINLGEDCGWEGEEVRQSHDSRGSAL